MRVQSTLCVCFLKMKNISNVLQRKSFLENRCGGKKNCGKTMASLEEAGLQKM